MNKRMFPVLIFIAILILGGGFYLNNHSSETRTTINNKGTSSADKKQPVESQFISIADSYIISLVGEDYFKTNYIFSESNSRGSNYWNGVYYEYIPLSKLNNQPTYISVAIHREKPDSPSGHVVCKKDGKICDLKISKEQAVQIVRNAGFNPLPEDISLSDNPRQIEYIPENMQSIQEWWWDFSIAVPAGKKAQCLSRDNLRISILTGELTNLGKTTACF